MGQLTRVRYGPFEKRAAHAHTPRPSAYVYLNDGGPVRFTHIGGHGTVATRPATKAGAFRVCRGLEEIHEVENTSDLPSDFLRVELKTEAVSQETFRGKFERSTAIGDGTTEQVQFDHPQARISRIRIAPNEVFTIRSAEGEPSLLIALVPIDPAKVGQESWLTGGHTVEIRNEGKRGAELLRNPAPTAAKQSSHHDQAGDGRTGDDGERRQRARR